MSNPAQKASLSWPARLFCYFAPPSAILLTGIGSPGAALLSIVTFLPTAWLFKKWRDSNNANPSRRGELEVMVWTFAAAGTIGLAVVALFQIAICSVATRILFQSSEIREEFWTEFARSTIDGLTKDEQLRRAQLARSWQNWVFNGILTYVVAGLVEETLKYLPIAYARRRGTPEQRQPHNRAYIDYAVAGALSFAVVENIGFLYAACVQGKETWPKLLLTLCERMGGALGHPLVACLTALRAIRRDYYGDQMSWFAVVGPAVVLHGTYDFIAMGASALEGNVGWIHPSGVRNTTAMIGLITGVNVLAAWLVRREWKAVDNRDRQ